ncbi:MAG TPA: hypothetical protein VGB59_06975 [Allosphingosinicella sp.]
MSWVPLALSFGLASCSYAPRAAIRNATGADLLLWPLSERPLTLKAGENSHPIHYTAHERQQALIQRGDCLYTYPAPDYFQLPKGAKGFRANVVAVIHEDMILHVHQRSKKGVEGPEILVAGFPLKPSTFCGRRGGG